MKGELEHCSKKSTSSTPNALLITIILLVGTGVLLSQQGLDLGELTTSFTSRSPGRGLLRTTPTSSGTPPLQEPAAPNPNHEDSDSDPASSPPALEEQDSRGLYSTIRHLQPVGLGSYAFVLTGGYRTHERSFAVVGLASKPFHSFGKPEFKCEWRSNNESSSNVFGKVRKLLPDWGYGRVYTVVVIHCSFNSPVGDDRSGGELILHVGNIDPEIPSSKLVALEESPGEFDSRKFSPPYKYDYLYCGSSLFGKINPQRLREWIAYHAMLFGERSHFVLHDAGVENPEELHGVLEPWVRLGYVTLQDFREQAGFDGYYYNQFLVVNDCLFRHKFDAEWMFFFDVDEYVYIPKPGTLRSVLDRFGRNYSQIMFEQNLMSHNACVAAEKKTSGQWGFEKLVYKNVKTSVRLDRKYVLKPALADSAGVHLSEHFQGQKLYSSGKIVYYHFHNTINEMNENCQVFWRVPTNNSTKILVGKTPYVYDNTLASMASAAKAFELQQIGPQTNSNSM